MYFNSDRAIEVNIRIIRIFTRIREAITTNLNLKLEIEEIKRKVDNQNKNIEQVFSYLDEFLNKDGNTEPRTQIGFKSNSKK